MGVDHGIRHLGGQLTSVHLGGQPVHMGGQPVHLGGKAVPPLLGCRFSPSLLALGKHFAKESKEEKQKQKESDCDEGGSMDRDHLRLRFPGRLVRKSVLCLTVQHCPTFQQPRYDAW